MKEVNTTPKGIEIPADKLMSVVLDRSVSDKDQTIGAHRQTIKFLEQKAADLTEDLNIEKSKATVIPDDQKVMVISDSKSKRVCPSCGYDGNGGNHYCYECEYSLKGVQAGPKVIEYRNLDKVIADIRKEEAKSLKVDNVELEKQLDNTEFKLNKVTNTLKNVESTQSQDLTDGKREVRERYQKENKELEKSFLKVVDDNESKIDELVEEIQKLEENKTDAEVEELRKQEIIDLKSQVEDLEATIEEAKQASTNRMKKFWLKIADRKEQLKLEEEKEDKKDRIDQISNSYPKAATNKTTPWWRKGKYAKKIEDTIKEANEALRESCWKVTCGSKTEEPILDGFYSNMAQKAFYGQ